MPAGARKCLADPQKGSEKRLVEIGLNSHARIIMHTTAAHPPHGGVVGLSSAATQDPSDEEANQIENSLLHTEKKKLAEI